MKNLKMFAIAVMAFAVMAMGVHAAEPVNGITGLQNLCNESTVEGTCTLKGNVTTLAGTVSEDLTIVSSGSHSVTIGRLSIAKNVTLTIKGGNVKVNGSTTINVLEGASLIITGAAEDVTAITSSNGGTINVAKNGTLSVVDNAGKGFVGTGSTELEINLTRAKMEVSRNGLNAMNGTTKITASESTIEAKDNGLGGINATLVLTDESKVIATGNGYSGVTLNDNSNIEEGSTITATGNLKGSDKIKPDRTPDKADVSLKGTVTLAGEIVTDSIGPEKDFWSQSANIGKVATGMVTFEDNGKVNAKATKEVCDGTGSAVVGGTCETPIAVTYGGDGVAIEGDTATVYGSADVELTSAVKKVIIDKNSTGANVTVAPGTEVENKTSSKLFVKTTDGTIYEVDTKKSATLGVAAPTPEEQQPGSEGENPGNQGGTGNVPNPNTNDNILVYAGLGLVSLATVTFTTRKRED